MVYFETSQVEIKGKVHLAPPHRARLPPPPALPSTFFTPAQVLNWFGLLFGLQSAVFLGVIWYIGISACEQVCSRTGWDEDRKFHDRLGKRSIDRRASQQEKRDERESPMTRLNTSKLLELCEHWGRF